MLSSLNLKGPAEVMPGVLIAPTGGLTHFVHSSGAAGLDLLPPGMTAPMPGGFFTSVAAALAATGSSRNNRGDVINVLQGHTESIATADAWSNLAATDVTVNCLGRGLARPTFTWTTATSTVLFDTSGFRLLNAQLYLAGPHVNGTALTVAAPITVSASGCEISGCRIFWGFDADQIVTIGITTTAAADDLVFDDNYCWAETAAVPTTTFLRLTGADQLRMRRTYIGGPGSTTAIGPVQMLTTACLKAEIVESRFQNTLAGSTIAFTAIAGCTGMVDRCGFGVLAAGNGLTTGSGLQVTNSKTAVAAAAGADTTG